MGNHSLGSQGLGPAAHLSSPLFWMGVLVAAFLVWTMVSMVRFGLTFAPFVPSGRRDTDRCLALSGLKAGERFLDLGSGDGRVVRRAA